MHRLDYRLQWKKNLSSEPWHIVRVTVRLRAVRRCTVASTKIPSVWPELGLKISYFIEKKKNGKNAWMI